MSNYLKLYNTFTKKLNPVELSGKLYSFYICGPTVYSDCHVGHALTYIRADLFRRFLKAQFNVNLQTVMNITDIDDKILDKTLAKEVNNINVGDINKREINLASEPSSHPFNILSDHYYKRFLADMELIRVLPVDLYVKVSKQMHIITKFINQLERYGHTYISSTGDVHFKTNSVKNYKGRIDNRQKVKDSSKIDARDFVLWKLAKPNEPIWLYESNTGITIPGRPGWHVQCSALSSALFGSKLDFHFGGKDLIFPHHYNEEACSCAFHSLDTSESLHVWVKHWLHSGHLVVKDTKMSKSLGNVISINNFIGRSSVNALRLLCVCSHYRADVEFNEDLLDKVKSLDHKISAFNSFLDEQLSALQNNLPDHNYHESCFEENDLESSILKTKEEIFNGVCEDFNLEIGLESILTLSKIVYSKDKRTINPRDLISIWSLLKDWCYNCGLEYGGLHNSTSNNEELMTLLWKFRQNVRSLAVNELKGKGVLNSSDNDSDSDLLRKLLKECDNVRSKMDELGFVYRDPKA